MPGGPMPGGPVPGGPAPAFGGPMPGGPAPAYYGPPPPGYGWRPPPVPVAPDGRPLADFGIRLLSHLIDGAIVGGIATVVFLPVMFIFVFNVMPDFPSAADPSYTPTFDPAEFFIPFLLLELGFFVLLFVAYYVYYVEMMYRSGQTVGKKLMKIKVVPLEPGAVLTRGIAAKRYLIEFVVGIIVPFFTYLDGLWQLWDKPYQQTLHDKVAKTVVVKVAP
ncbi:RDD domain-containing protein [Actinoplanes friuliensis DSM 7358]|uniref:RDD domain-containing protein n=2 Tax=Actinoplanes friuliensis TaxID=196914 RepID=U5WEL3_9ACTN|nr:RDD domain-containing protein [Actinoplanes friuliensis DSM 7358]